MEQIFIWSKLYAYLRHIGAVSAFCTCNLAQAITIHTRRTLVAVGYVVTPPCTNIFSHITIDTVIDAVPFNFFQEFAYRSICMLVKMRDTG
jgi:hypothetical protein